MQAGGMHLRLQALHCKRNSLIRSRGALISNHRPFVKHLCPKRTAKWTLCYISAPQWLQCGRKIFSTNIVCFECDNSTDGEITIGVCVCGQAGRETPPSAQRRLTSSATRFSLETSSSGLKHPEDYYLSMMSKSAQASRICRIPVLAR